MVVVIDRKVVETVAADIGTDDPEEIARAMEALWLELGNPVEMIEDVREEVPAE